MNKTKSTSDNSTKESEMMVLGCMINNVRDLKHCSEALELSDFQFPEHKILFQLFRKAAQNQKPIDLHLICKELSSLEKLEKVGGTEYVFTLAQYSGTSAYAEEYANLVKQASYTRSLNAFLIASQQDLRSGKEPSSITETLQHNITTLSKKYLPNDKVFIGDILQGNPSKSTSPSLLEKIKLRHTHFASTGQPFSTGLPTGFSDLDSQTTILEPKNLVVIAGRPAMGKTAFAIEIVNHLAIHNNIPVGVISLEMSSEQLVERIISSQSRVPLLKIKRGDFTITDLKKIEKTISKIKQAPIFLHDQGFSSISEVVTRARRLKDEDNIQLLVIDYLQLLGTSQKSESRQYEVAEVSRRLKLLAMELDIPIISVAQLSRKVEERGNKRPLLSDLRDSGQIEQDCDVALFIYRRDYYDQNDKPGQAEIVIAKNRNGPELNIQIAFQKEYGKFENLPSNGGKDW